MTSPQLDKPMMPLLLRFAAYTAVIFVFTASLPLITRHGDVRIFAESGPVEWLQISLLVATSLVFVAGACIHSVFRELFIFLACITVFAAVRELDSLLDNLIPWIGWKFGFLIVLYAVGLAYMNRKKFKRQFAYFLSSPVFPMLWASFIVVVPVAQLLGHGPFLEAMLGTGYDRSYKRVVEESGEFVGYLLLLAGSVESFLQLQAARLMLPAPAGKVMARH